MPFFKLELKNNPDQTNQNNLNNFVVVQAQKGKFLRRGLNDYKTINESIEIEYDSYAYRNQWVYINFMIKNNQNNLVGSVMKFNNNIYMIELKNITDIKKCTKEFYHKHKNIKGEPKKRTYIIRDSQKSKVYNSEDFYTKFQKLNNNEVMEFINKVTNSVTYKKLSDQFINAGIDFEVNLKPRGKTWARGGASGLILPDWSKSEFIIIHELSHLIVQRLFSHQTRLDKNIQGHGKEFCFIFLYLIQEFLDESYFYNLLKGFEKYKVKYLTEFIGLSL